MSDFLRSYLTVGIFGLLAVVLVSALLGISSLLRPTRPQAQKYINYESGVDPVGSGWGQSNIRYYIFALLFVMFDVEAVFIAIGHQPNTSLFVDKLDLDDAGYVKVKPGTTQTSIEGVYACGDVSDPTYRQAVTAAGTGCMAAIESERWLAEQGIE